jgi:hypothetical protein
MVMRTTGLSSFAISATTVLVGFLILFPLAMLLYGSLWKRDERIGLALAAFY